MAKDTVPAAHRKKARALVKEMRVHGGLAPVDMERFWADEEVAGKDPFGTSIPQVPLGVWMSDECVFAELKLKEDFWKLLHDHDWRLQQRKAYNRKAEKIVGRKLLNETPHDPTRQYPPVKMLHDVFEAKNEWHAESWWLRQNCFNEGDLQALLDRVEQRLSNLREFILPPNWAEEKARLTALGVKPPLYRSQRGPVTFATSIYGIENLIFLLMDKPDVAARFRDAIRKTMLEIARVLDEEAGYTVGRSSGSLGDPEGRPAMSPRGFSFFDDNCCMLNKEMYEFFGLPVLKALFERYSPGPTDSRYQHSDSAMGHHLPALGTLGMTGLNLGPTVRVADIRRHCPKAVIYGQLAPFTFSRNEEEQIVLEFLRDYDQAREQRGLCFATAGSINNGSRLTGMRLIMAAIQRYGRYG